MKARLLLCAFAAACLPFSQSFAADLGTDAQKAEGEALYEKHCAHCHGIDGAAKTKAAGFYKPRPRDFTSGKYKVRTTLTGELPTDDDIKRAIRKGFAFHLGKSAYTTMPPWPNFSEEQLSSVMFHLKSFSSDFADDSYNNPQLAELPSAPAFSEESAKKGRTVFENNDCIKCHGTYGRSDGPSAPTLEDDWGYHLRPADLSKRWTFRGGAQREDIFRTVTTGFNGTPMPAYGDTLTPEERWQLADYVYSLSTADEANYTKPDKAIVAKAVKAPIDTSSVEAAKASFAGSEVSYIALAGQVVEPGRGPHPAVNAIEVQAAYSEGEIGILLSWNDMQAETSGSNGPGVETPLFTAEVSTKASEDDDSDGGDPFADEEASDPFADDMEEESDPFADEEEGAGAVASGKSYPFSDAVAVQLPTESVVGFKKPYFIFGDSSASVDIWFRDLAKEAAQTFSGRGSGSLTAKDDVPLESAAEYKDGKWTVVFKRVLEAEGATPFSEGSIVPVAFSVWDGFTEDRGNRRALTPWYNIYVEPMEQKSPVLPMLTYGGGLFLLELALIGWVRKRKES